MSNGAPITWKVTSVTPDTQYTATATPVPGKRVAFTTSIGYDDAVFVPNTVFADTSAWRQIIEAEVTKVAAAQAVTGTIGG